jgi:hypothetical protein
MGSAKRQGCLFSLLLFSTIGSINNNNKKIERNAGEDTGKGKLS